MSTEPQVHVFETGAKRGTDHLACDISLIPPEAIRAWGRAFAEGREKYGLHNWLKGFPQMGVLNHALMHIYKYIEGDRSEDHLGHALWNIGTAIHQDVHRPDLMDLPPYRESTKVMETNIESKFGEPVGKTENDLRSRHQQQVDQFMRNAKQDLPSLPTLPDVDVRKLRAKLILEEAVETVEALGFSLIQNADGSFDFVAEREPNLVEIIDGCCDVAVVTTGTLSACGVPDRPFQHAVNQNNLDKFGPGHSWREDGKLIKPPGHKPPDIAAILHSL